MKYRLLLSGKNNTIIDDFFTQLQSRFDFVTTSRRYDDIFSHIEFFKPDAFVYCLYDEAQSDIQRLVELNRNLPRNSLPFIVIGSREACEEFQRFSIYLANLVIVKPITAVEMSDKIVQFLDERMEEKRQIEEAAKQEKELQRRSHVLVIDDDPLMLKLIKEYLHDSYDVGTAISGRIAFKFLENRRTDLILLDYEMPGENGPQVLAKLREDVRLSDIPVIFLTGTKEKEKIQAALTLRPQGYLLKPIERDKLLETITKYIG